MWVRNCNAIEKGMIVLSQHLFNVDEKVLCEDVLHELVHAAGFDEDMADELTNVLSERLPKIIASEDESSKATRELIEKGIDPVTKLKQYALPLRKC